MAEEENDNKKNSSKYFYFGLATTFIWLVVVYGLVKNPTFTDLKLNEVGDFLAGAVAPIAFLWLVLAYLIQSEELKLQRDDLQISIDALQGQEKELIEQTKQLTEQAELTRKDIKLRLAEATPRLAFKEINSTQVGKDFFRHEVLFYNNGGIAIGIKCHPPHKDILIEIQSLYKDSPMRKTNSIKTDILSKIVFQYNQSIYHNVSIQFTYLDIFGTEYKHLTAYPCTDEEWEDFFNNPKIN